MFPASQVVALPRTGIASLSVSATTLAGCDDQYVAAVMAVVYTSAALPAVPAPACPCWAVPINGACGGIQLPIYLSTEVS